MNRLSPQELHEEKNMWREKKKKEKNKREKYMKRKRFGVQSDISTNYGEV